MTLTKHNHYPASHFGSFVDRFFPETTANNRLNRFVPSVDIVENEKEFQLKVAVPGVSKEDIKLEFVNGRLTISGERKLKKEDSNDKFHTIETQYGAFTRSFTLSDNVKAEDLQAKYEDGVLVVSIPKKEEEKVQKEIVIQ